MSPGTFSNTSSTWRVRVFRPFPGCPDVVFGHVAARSAAFRGSGPAAGDQVVGAAAGANERQVTERARGELLERMHNILAGRRVESGQAPAVTATFEELRKRGVPALDPASWSGPAGCPEVRQALLVWVTGTSLLDGNEVLVPASAAFLRHRPPAGCAAPMRPGSTGIAAHLTTEAASDHALLEVLERDLFWRAWYGWGPRRVCNRIPPEPLPSTLISLGIACTVVLLPGPDKTGCVTACLHGPDCRRQSFGARASRTVDDETALAKAIGVAVYEALMVRWSMATPQARAVWRKMSHARPASPVGPLEHALHTFHRQDSLLHLLAKSPANRYSSTPPALSDRPLAYVLADHTQDEVVWVDTTVPELGGDMVIGRVVAPGAHRLPAEEQVLRASTGAPLPLPHPLG